MSNQFNNSASYSQYAATDENTGQEATVQPRRLELSINPEDGSLLTAPLMSVLLAATDGFYSDLYNMIQGEIDITTAILPRPEDSATLAGANTGDQNDDENHISSSSILRIQTKRERMSKLSFAERRHELSWRLVANGKSIQHVAALCAAAASTQFAEATEISSKALQHTRTAWVQADEAQDALYFFHAQLFPSRAAPHDVYGAADIICDGQWYDLPRDLRLTVDRYENSVESTWDANETDQRWQLAVRNKLITGEVGWTRRKLLLQEQQRAVGEGSKGLNNHVEIKPPLWDVTLCGGVVKFRHGKPKQLYSPTEKNTNDQHSESEQQQSSTTMPGKGSSSHRYPIEALLTVFPNENPALSEWTLLSVDIHVQAKTGEFNHQLETSNRQRYDLHRLAALAMSREEARHRRENNILGQKLSSSSNDKQQEATTIKESNDKKDKTIMDSTESKVTDHEKIEPSHPLHSLFQVVHTFSLSWQLELLSAQAQALRRGVWAAADGMPIEVLPVRFFDNNNNSSTAATTNNILGIVSILFWKVDNAFGSPSMGDISLVDDKSTSSAIIQDDTTNVVSSHMINQYSNDGSPTSQLALSIRAEVNVGIRVSLSGGNHIMNQIRHQGTIDPSDLRQKQLCSTVHDLLESSSNPFCLSASDALLAATKLCAEMKCQAVVDALQPTLFSPSFSSGGGGGERKFTLPPWIVLSVDRGSISVAAKIQYYGVEKEEEEAMNHDSKTTLPILFRVMCDARTGTFVNTFPRSMNLLRKLTGTDMYYASEAMAVRITSLPENRKKAAGSHSSNRIVRDAFDGLIRSMNLLGQRCGVGISVWDNIDNQSAYLRERSIYTACMDVKTSLIKCCGMAALYGFTPLAFSTATGLEAMPDIAGEAINNLDGYTMLHAPPISVLIDQQLIETSHNTLDGVSKKTSHVEQSLFAVSCSVDDIQLTLFPFDISITLETLSSIPQRTSCTLLKFVTKKKKMTIASDDEKQHQPQELLRDDVAGVAEIERQNASKERTNGSATTTSSSYDGSSSIVNDNDLSPPTKRTKLDEKHFTNAAQVAPASRTAAAGVGLVDDVFHESTRFAQILSCTIDSELYDDNTEEEILPSR